MIVFGGIVRLGYGMVVKYRKKVRKLKNKCKKDWIWYIIVCMFDR